MKTSDKVTVLILAFEGLLGRQEMKQADIMALFELQDEIGTHMQTHLPKDKLIHFNSKISELRGYTEAMFKTQARPNEMDLMACLAKIGGYTALLPHE